MILTEREIRILYDSARNVVEQAMTQVTIDVHVVEAEQHCKTYAIVLGEKYVAPKRKR